MSIPSSHKWRRLGDHFLKSHCSLAIVFFVLGRVAVAGPSLKDLDNAFEKGQWDETVEVAYEMLLHNPHLSVAKLKGAYALFQKGYTNGALYWLKSISSDEWKKIPQGQERLIEIVSLFQKKVPLDILPGRLEKLSPEDAPASLRDEVIFAKGRQAFDEKKYEDAKNYLTSVSLGSRFFSEARYILGTIAAFQLDYKSSSIELSRIFESTAFEQSTEFWKDMNSQMTSHWGPSLKVMIDTEALRQTNEVRELAQIGLARVAYGAKDYELALQRYEKIPPGSPIASRVMLEKIWTLLALNRHEEAQNAALQLTTGAKTFESIEARVLRALILTDKGLTDQARVDLQTFNQIYDQQRLALRQYKSFLGGITPPEFLNVDLKSDIRLQKLAGYENSLKQEMQTLRTEDSRLFPVYFHLSTELAPLVTQSRATVTRIIQGHIERRLNDLERLHIQSKLITAETYLEDREKLRNEFRAISNPSPEKQHEHDRRLVQLLTSAVKEVDEAMALSPTRHWNLEFRQSELLWELSAAHAILAQVENKNANEAESLELKMRAIDIANKVVREASTFKKHADALFFLGFAQLEVGKVTEGRANLLKYVAKYPRHSSIPDAYRMLGDMKFDENQFSEAEKYYGSILSFQDSPVFGYALYKIGWSAYNERNYAKSLLAMEQAVLWASRMEKTQQLLSLKKEARHDLIAIYAEVGDYRKAPEYFQRFLQTESLEWVAELANQLELSGQFEKANEVYQMMVSLDPGAKENLAYETAIIRGTYKLRQWQKLLDTVRMLIDQYGAAMTEPQPETSPAGITEKTIREAVLGQLFEFGKVDESKADRERILDLNHLYLTVFEKWPSSEAPLYQHAYFLAKRNQWEEAAPAFEKHWTLFQSTIKEPAREEALRNLIGALEALEKKVKESETPSPSYNSLLTYTSEYLKSYPNGKQAHVTASLRCYLFFKYKQTEQGIKESQVLFDKGPGQEFGKLAFKNMKVAYYQLKDWKRAYEWASAMAGRPQGEMGAYNAELKTMREETLFLWAESTPDPKTSAEIYLNLARDPSMPRLRTKSLYNAFIQYQKADLRRDALLTAQLLEQGGATNEVLSLAGTRAAFYEESGDYARALPMLETLLAHPQKETTQDVLEQARLNAALIAQAYGDKVKSDRYFHQYADHLEKGKTVNLEAKLALAQSAQAERNLASQEKRWADLQQALSEFERAPLGKDKELAKRLSGGAQRLEGLVKDFFAFSSVRSTPIHLAYEAYCAVPFLYLAYLRALDEIGAKNSDELRTEIAKIGSPIKEKADQVAAECVKKAEQAEHEGPFMTKVELKWGWRKDAKLDEQVQMLDKALEAHGPFLDPVVDSLTEDAWINKLLDQPKDGLAWYGLAQKRIENGHWALARLTLVDAMAKAGKNAAFLNALAYTHWKLGRADATALFSKAAADGDALAFANLASIHLKARRLAPAKQALTEALQRKVFDNENSLRSLASEVAHP